MKRVVIFDTYQGSLNEGDAIINEYINKEMAFILDDANIVRFSTHLPISRWYQTFRKNIIYKTCNSANYKFLFGTNLFHNSLLRISPNWNINFTSVEYYRNSIAVGCGMEMNSRRTNLYTKWVYKGILSKDYIHSVRDERTKAFLESLGFRAINTGCPSLWGLTPDFCKEIPVKKSANVIFTITDYKRDYQADKKLVDILRRNYNHLYFWIQGYDDLDYLQELTDISDITIVTHSLEAYRQALQTPDLEYVGTRLHAGIYAMRHGLRSIIISVDNRAEDMKKTYDLKVISRATIEQTLEDQINSEYVTSVAIPIEKINEWKDQFK